MPRRRMASCWLSGCSCPLKIPLSGFVCIKINQKALLWGCSRNSASEHNRKRAFVVFAVHLETCGFDGGGYDFDELFHHGLVTEGLHARDALAIPRQSRAAAVIFPVRYAMPKLDARDILILNDRWRGG